MALERRDVVAGEDEHVSKQKRTLPEVMPDLGITMGDYQKLCMRAFENLPADTGVTIDDVDSVLTWCLPEYNRMKQKRQHRPGIEPGVSGAGATVDSPGST